MVYHISPATGNPNICRAKDGNCPYGGASDHFETKDEARQAYEQKMADTNEDLRALKRSRADDAWEPYVSEEERAIRGSGEPPKVYEGNGVHLNPATAERGDVVVDAGGNRWQVAFSYGNPPTVNLTRLNEDGSLSDRQKTIGEGSYNLPEQFEQLDETPLETARRELVQLENNPARHQYGFPEDEMIRYNIEQKIKEAKATVEELEAEEASVTAAANLTPSGLSEAAKEAQALEDFYSEPSIARRLPRSRQFYGGTEATYAHVALAEVQYNKLNPGQPVRSAAEAGTKMIVMPDVQKLTKKKKLEIGEELWRVSGRPMKAWNEGTEEQRLRWADAHVHRYTDTTVSVKGDQVDLSLDGGRRSTHGRNGDDVLYMHNGRTS